MPEDSKKDESAEVSASIISDIKSELNVAFPYVSEEVSVAFRCVFDVSEAS